MSIEDLMKVAVPTVYGASKFEQKVSVAPSCITIITSEEIQKFGHRAFDEVLRSFPGLFVTYDRNYSFIGTRGFMGPGSYNGRSGLECTGARVKTGG